MKEYIVTVTEVLEKQVKIDADSEEDAMRKAREAYIEEEIVLGPEDFQDVEFRAEKVRPDIKQVGVMDNLPVYSMNNRYFRISDVKAGSAYTDCIEVAQDNNGKWQNIDQHRYMIIPCSDETGTWIDMGIQQVE